jgi:hypothetical protein
VSVAVTDTAAPDQRIALNEGVQAAFGATFVFAVCCAAVAIALTLLRHRTPAAVEQAAPTNGAAL